MATRDSDGRNKRCRGSGDGADDDNGEIGRNKRCGHDGTGERIDGGSDVSGGHAEETVDVGSDEDCLYDYCGDEEDHEETKEDDDSACEKEQRYIVLSEEVVRARQEADTAKVAEVLSVPMGLAAVLLRHFKWRAGRVQEEWFSDGQRIRDAVGLPADGGVPIPMTLNRKLFVCGICFDLYSAGQMRSAGCPHYYCDDCWRGYVSAAVADGPGCLALRCPEPSCSAAVVQELVDEVAEDGDKARYARFALRSYVEESSGRIKWCPGPDCTRAVEFLGCAGDATEVFCECKHGFCWSCGEEAHRPVSCDMVRAWLTKNSSDSGTANWVLANTKHCPKCRRPIEKNQGCNHMTCRAPCFHDFCWICLDPWRQHYGCEGFRTPQDNPDAGNMLVLTQEEERRRQAQASLDRYLYHYERWAANHTSLEKVYKDMAELESSEIKKMAAALDLPESDFNFLTKAYQQIADGRRVLRWTYAYGYYLDPVRDAKKRGLFEDLQDQANSCLERLHGAAELERKEIFSANGEADIVIELLKYYRQKVVNLTAVTRTFLENLVKAFETNDLPEFKSLN